MRCLTLAGWSYEAGLVNNLSGTLLLNDTLLADIKAYARLLAQNTTLSVNK
jgi:hypothetical protein